MIQINLTPDELYAGSVIGIHRRISSIFKRTKPELWVSEDSKWSIEIESALAEMAYAKYKNRYWSGMIWDGKVATADVGKAQIRWTHHRDGHLIVYNEDTDEAPYVLVIGTAPVYTIMGWIVGTHAKNPEYWRIPPEVKTPAFFVPQAALTLFE